MITKPKVGQVVYLNDEGLDICHLLTVEAIRQSQRMTITWVDEESLTYPEETYQIKVDQPLIDIFLLDNWMVSEVV